MSRLRRPFLADRFFFVTVRLLPHRPTLNEADFARLARSLRRSRAKHGFLLTAWVFLPDHWHAIVFPRYPLTISRVMKSIKVASTTSIQLGWSVSGELWQGRFFDHALRTVKDYMDSVEYIHLNPVRRGLVSKPQDWKWSSVHEYSGLEALEQERRCGLTIDRITLPAEQRTRI